MNVLDVSRLITELQKYSKTHLNYYVTFVPGGSYEFRVYDKGEQIGKVVLGGYPTENELYNAIIKEFDRCESIYRSKLHRILE